MFIKVLIVFILLAVIVSLFSGLFFLVKDQGRSMRVLNSLAVRVSLSLLLLVVIALALWTGHLHLNPTP